MEGLEMDVKLELEQNEQRLNSKLTEYHNEVLSVCSREKGTWNDANKLLKQIIYLCDKDNKLRHNYAKLALEEAFTPELRKMLEEKQGKENET